MIRKNLQQNTGAAMMILVIFMLFISLTIIVGIVTPVVREFQIAGTSLNSNKAYFLAESGSEDAFYRLRANKKIASSETITLDGNSVTTTITASGGSTVNTLVSTGSASSNQRSITLAVKNGTGVVFKYGTQAGIGGIDMSNNAGLLGSLYSNGNISGSNNAYITGNAYAANSSSLILDQSNVSPLPPSGALIFGKTSAAEDAAQSFQITTSGLINKVEFYVKKNGSPPDATVKLVTDSSGSPSASVVASGTLTASTVATNFNSPVTVTFATNPEIYSGTTYWLVMDSPSNSSTNYYTLGTNTSYASGQAKTGKYTSSWSALSPSNTSIYFNLYTGGINSSISNISIGTSGVGDAFAHTITGSTIAGTAYCQTGSGNNKSCNTSKSDPTPESLPISDSNIASWEADAANGGVINGNYTVSTPTSLGPKKIVGNLTVSSTLTLTNTLWVTGNVTINNTVKLTSAYGINTGIIIADGNITIANGVTFQDSGTTGSYIMLLSNSICDSAMVGNPCGSNNAIDANNNSSLIILNAQKGAIQFSNNAGAKELVANKVKISNNAIISYGSGSINVGFGSGTLGSWIVTSWQETQ